MKMFNVSTTLLIDRNDEEIEVEIAGTYTPAVRSYFNALTGDGDPGCGAEADITSVLYQGQPFELSEKEEERALEALIEAGQEEEGNWYDDRGEPEDYEEPDDFGPETFED